MTLTDPPRRSPVLGNSIRGELRQWHAYDPNGIHSGIYTLTYKWERTDCSATRAKI